VTQPVFILVHGAWHGAWCWHKLVPLLEAAGARVFAPDFSAQATLESACDLVAEVVDRHPGGVVVGHSLGGAVISRVAERLPSRIRQLVYLAGYLLARGGSVAQAARGDVGSLLAPNMIPVERGVSCAVRAEVLRDVFYGNCSDADFEFARERVTPQPLKLLVATLDVSEQAFGLVPRAYIETARDRVVSLDAQRRMQATWPCAPVFTLDSDHSPFLSQPDALARILISI
jgi:pimeloyl-ACP methyl ester carboxylesterase